MALEPMEEAVPGATAKAAEYNHVVHNVLDLDARLGSAFTPVDNVSTWATGAQSSITALKVAMFGSSSRSTIPSVTVSRSTGQTFTNGVHGQIAYNTAVQNDGFSFNSSTGAITVPFKGRYHVGMLLRFLKTSTTGVRNGYVTINSTDFNTATLTGSATGDQAVMSAGISLNLAAGDVVRFFAYQNGGGNLDTDTAYGGTKAWITWAGPTP